MRLLCSAAFLLFGLASALVAAPEDELRLAGQVHCLEGHRFEVDSVAFTSDGEFVLSASSDRTLRVWKVGTGEEVGRHRLKRATFGRLLLHTHEDQTASVMCCDRDETVIWRWDYRRNKMLDRRRGDGLITTAQEFSPEGKHVVCGTSTGVVRLIRVKTAEVLEGWNAHGQSTVADVAVRGDSGAVASAGFDGRLRTWSLPDGKPGETFSSDQGAYFRVAFSPHGDLLAGTLDDGRVELWDLTGETEKPRVLKGHKGYVNCLKFTSDGKRLLTGGYDTTLRVWDVSAGREIITLRGHRSKITSIALSPNERQAATGSFDCTVRIWLLP